MAEWDSGYVTDVVYVRNVYREMTPTWLAATALLIGQRPPDLAKPFRYADLGCGHGLTATFVAATCPQAEVWAFDLNPAHIESGRQLAEAAGLTNLHFQEASFSDLAALPAGALPDFDFIVSHGVMSWISPENRAKLIQVIEQRLRPGGLAYLSYNVATGWASMVPLRSLMRMLMRSNSERSDLAVGGVLDYLDSLRESGATFFAGNPTAERRLADVRKQDTRYLAHEFLNEDWHPLMFADVAAAMDEARCTYIGSATLTENIDPVSVPAKMMGLVTEASSRVLKETLRDFGISQAFRRDLYRRGTMPMMGPEQMRLINAMELTWTGREPEDPITLTAPIGQVQGLPEVYRPIMQMIMANDCSIGQLRQSPALAARPAGEVLQAVSLLMSSSFIHPLLPASVRIAGAAGTRRLNMAIAAFNGDGGDINRLASPATGSEVGVDVMETLIVLEKLSGRSMELDGLNDRVLAALTQAGRAVQRDGKPVQDMNQARGIIRSSVESIMQQRFGLLRRLGVIGE